MKKLFFLATFVCLCSYTFAQSPIVIQNNGIQYMSYRIDSIKVNIQNGDTIYFPEGNFSLYGNWEIDKEVHIFGIGHHPDSGATVFSNNTLYFIQGANNSTVEGIHFLGDIRMGTSYTNDNVSNISIRRCRVNSLHFGFNANTTAQLFNISECLIHSHIYGHYATGVTFEKCIINNWVRDFNNNVVFKNNVFMAHGSASTSYAVFYSVSNSSFENNIILSHYDHRASNCLFNNNILLTGASQGAYSNVYNSQNIYVAHRDSVYFVNLNGNVFDYQQDLHLSPNSPGINAGSDNTNLGIYGTAFPAKEGFIPAIPRVHIFNIAPNSVNGKIPAEIKVEAQTSF